MAIRYEDIPVRDGGFTTADLDEMPDDGRRYELVDGVLLVSPAPRWEHQHGGVRLAVVLDAACPRHLAVLMPVDVRRGERTSVQPDLSVVRTEHLVRGEPFAAVPVLAVEILSPASIGIDRLLKREVYARLGVAHYWIVDLDEPSVTVLDLCDGTYREQTVARDQNLLEVDEPFTVAFRPADLLTV
jgi:Uma2 family endonuclease